MRHIIVILIMLVFASSAYADTERQERIVDAVKTLRLAEHRDNSLYAMEVTIVQLFAENPTQDYEDIESNNESIDYLQERLDIVYDRTIYFRQRPRIVHYTSYGSRGRYRTTYRYDRVARENNRVARLEQTRYKYYKSQLNDLRNHNDFLAKRAINKDRIIFALVRTSDGRPLIVKTTRLQAVHFYGLERGQLWAIEGRIRETRNAEDPDEIILSRAYSDINPLKITRDNAVDDVIVYKGRIMEPNTSRIRR